MKLEYSIVVLAISIAFSGFWIGQSLQENENVEQVQKDVQFDENLTLPEAARYLEISEESIKKIIIQEQVHFEKYKSFNGMRFPYTKIYGKYIFSKEELDKWMKSTNRREYSVDGISQM